MYTSFIARRRSIDRSLMLLLDLAVFNAPLSNVPVPRMFNEMEYLFSRKCYHSPPVCSLISSLMRSSFDSRPVDAVFIVLRNISRV